MITLSLEIQICMFPDRRELALVQFSNEVVLFVDDAFFLVSFLCLITVFLNRMLFCKL